MSNAAWVCAEEVSERASVGRRLDLEGFYDTHLGRQGRRAGRQPDRISGRYQAPGSRSERAMKFSELIQKTLLPAQLGWVKASARRMLLEMRLSALRERLPELTDEEVIGLLEATRPHVPPPQWANDSIVKGLHQFVRTLGGSFETRARVNGRDADVDPLGLRLELDAVLDADAPSASARSAAFDAVAWQAALRTTAGAAAIAQTMAGHVRRAVGSGARQAPDWTSASLGMVADILEACHSRLQEFSPSEVEPAELSFLGAKPCPSQAKAPLGRPACGFCGKSQQEVKKLILGPGVHICNACIDLCCELLAAEAPG
jgi:hypothetical protein